MSSGRKLEAIFAVIVLITGIVLYLYSPSLVRGWAFTIPGTTDVALEPVFFPRLASILICLSSLNLLLTIPLRGKSLLPAQTTPKSDYLKVIFGLVGIFIYLICILYFGYVISTIIFVVSLSYIGGYKNLLVSFSTAILVTILLRIIFRYGLHVNLQMGLFF